MSWFGGYYKEPRNSFATYPSSGELLRLSRSRRSPDAPVDSGAPGFRGRFEALARITAEPGDAIPIMQTSSLGMMILDLAFELVGTFDYSGGELLPQTT